MDAKTHLVLLAVLSLCCSILALAADTLFSAALSAVAVIGATGPRPSADALGRIGAMTDQERRHLAQTDRHIARCVELIARHRS